MPDDAPPPPLLLPSEREVPAPTTEDLLENREGRLSARQEAMLRGAVFADHVSLGFHPDDPARRLDIPEEVGAPLAIGMATLVDLILGLFHFLHERGDAIPVEILVVAPLIAAAAILIWHRPWVRVVILRTHARFCRAVAADLAGGRVVSAVGVVAFEHGHYALRCNGELMRPPADRHWRLPLVPGTHRVHHLPQSRIVLALEPVAVLASTDTTYRTSLHEERRPAIDHSALTEALYRAHGIDRRGLADNRRGLLARGQIGGKVLRELAIGFAFSVMTLSIPVFATYHGIVFAAVITWVLLGSLGVVIVVTTSSDVAKLLLDWHAGEVRALEGSVGIDVQWIPRSPPTYSYVIGGEKIRVSTEAARALVPGMRYRVWITPRSKRIVGIEPVDLFAEDRAEARAELLR